MRQQNGRGAFEWMLRAWKFERNEILICACVTAAVYALTMYHAIRHDAFLLLIAIPSGLVAVTLYFVFIKRGKFEESDIHHALYRDTRDIVWIYPDITRLRPYGFDMWKRSFLVFRMRGRQRLKVRIKTLWIDEMMDALRHQVPNATFGYSKDKEQWYQADPELLIQTQDDDKMA